MDVDMKEFKGVVADWLAMWFETQGVAKKVVVDLSGDKMNLLCAALCVETLGCEKVIGVIMPHLTQGEKERGLKIAKKLSIQSYVVPISMITADIRNQLSHSIHDISDEATLSLSSEVRNAILRIVARSLGAAVVKTESDTVDEKCTNNNMCVPTFDPWGRNITEKEYASLEAAFPILSKDGKHDLFGQCGDNQA